MIEEGLPLYAIFGLLAGLSLTVGYLFGLRRFATRVRDELAEAATAADRLLAEAQAQALLPPPPRAMPLITHTVLLDGVSNSGKSTLVHRLAFPCTDPDALRQIAATQRAYPTRMLPICFVPSGVAGGGDDAPAQVLHAQVLRDIAGEKGGDIINIINELAAERTRPADGDARPGEVVVVLIWDMADAAGSRARITKDRLKIAYHNENARRWLKHFVVFFNKLDLLAVSPERAQQLIDDERAHLESITDFLDSDVTRTYCAGSALRGDGVIDCQGAIYTALGLAPQFRPTDKDGKAS